MHVLHHRHDVSKVEPPELRRVVEQRIDALMQEYPEYALSELALFVVLQPGDPLDLLTPYLGFPLLENYGQPGFTPRWELLEDHQCCYELVYVLGQDGYGVELFVPKREGIPTELLSICRAYAQPAEEPNG